MKIIETKTVVKDDGIKYTTHYISGRPQQGDLVGCSKGICIDGKEITTEIITYIFKYYD